MHQPPPKGHAPHHFQTTRCRRERNQGMFPSASEGSLERQSGSGLMDAAARRVYPAIDGRKGVRGAECLLGSARGALENAARR